MDFDSICIYANRLGGGAHSIAYKVPRNPGVVLLQEHDNDKERYAFMAWCAERLKRYGLKSPEMAMLPEVYWVKKSKGIRYCLMRRYHKQCKSNGSCWNETQEAVAYRFNEIYGLHFKAGDTHGGNIWMCPERNAWIVTDPIAQCQKPEPFTVAVDARPFKIRRVAGWKRANSTYQ